MNTQVFWAESKSKPFGTNRYHSVEYKDGGEARLLAFRRGTGDRKILRIDKTTKIEKDPTEPSKFWVVVTAREGRMRIESTPSAMMVRAQVERCIETLAPQASKPSGYGLPPKNTLHKKAPTPIPPHKRLPKTQIGHVLRAGTQQRYALQSLVAQQLTRKSALQPDDTRPDDTRPDDWHKAVSSALSISQVRTRRQRCLCTCV